MKTTKLYLIRHGESQGNQRDAFLGHTDLDLTDTGRTQALKTAEYLKQFPISAIYSSDLLRAYHTAQATSALMNIPIIKEERLREIFCGAWEDQPFSLLLEKYPKSYGAWINDIDNAHPDDGESTLELQARVIEALQEIAENNVGKTVAIFTHATPIRCFAAYCKGREKIKNVPWASNASVTEVEYKNSEFRLVAYSQDDFLGNLVTVLPENT